MNCRGTVVIALGTDAYDWFNIATKTVQQQSNGLPHLQVRQNYELVEKRK